MGLTFDLEEHPERFRFRRGDAVVRRDDSDASGIIVAGTREEEGSRYVEVYDIERPDGTRFRAEDVELDLAPGGSPGALMRQWKQAPGEP